MCWLIRGFSPTVAFKWHSVSCRTEIFVSMPNGSALRRLAVFSSYGGVLINRTVVVNIDSPAVSSNVTVRVFVNPTLGTHQNCVG